MRTYISKTSLEHIPCMYLAHLAQEIHHQTLRNQQPLHVCVPFLAPGPCYVGLSILKPYLASCSYFRAIKTLDSNPPNSSKGTSGWTNDQSTHDHTELWCWVARGWPCSHLLLEVPGPTCFPAQVGMKVSVAQLPGCPIVFHTYAIKFDFLLFSLTSILRPEKLWRIKISLPKNGGKKMKSNAKPIELRGDKKLKLQSISGFSYPMHGILSNTLQFINALNL